MRILLPGQPCPTWLERIEFTKPGPRAFHRVGTLSIVTETVVAGELAYKWRPLLPTGPLLVVRGDGAEHVKVVGQSPPGGNGGVYVAGPVIGWPELLLATIVSACVLAL